ncbi:mycofactocin system GMC family oxidoreductase MftG [Gryllotalpicola sp.]|uniref:mycofactocin dehydrogenase MftG n=1 Tax=Gryllotalpicola sp. TaxID=1932787 RepID=UPI002625362C|nr:mycofactocin system GMC family oxidoreductase MftG [Gryllotalpicola sp.]
MADSLRADVVIVGAGSAGCVLAARLSEDPARSVVLLESGSVPRDAGAFAPGVLDAGTVRGSVPGQAINWTIPGRIGPSRDYTTVRGRMLGGSSSINGGYFIRPRLADFADWAAVGGPEWSYERALPRMVALEHDLDYPASAIHGDHGPILVSRGGSDEPTAVILAAAAEASGYPQEPDKNDQGAPGYGPVPTNTAGGVRQNAGLAYVLPVMSRPNLTVLGDRTVSRVLLRGGRAIGVEYRTGSELHLAFADLVVLSAGAIGSAQLLIASGIGPEGELRRLGVPVAVPAPGVGASFSDHPQLTVEWWPRPPIPSSEASWLAGALHTEEIEVLASAKSMTQLTGQGSGGPLPLLVSVMTPRPTGRLRLRSADPATPPLLDYGYLDSAKARRELRDALRLVLELLETPSWRAARDPGDHPGPADRDEAGLDVWIAEHLGTAMHTTGTVPLGPDGPVDSSGRVLGVDGLIVADAGILPTGPRRGPALAAVLIGETISDAIRRRA